MAKKKAVKKKKQMLVIARVASSAMSAEYITYEAVGESKGKNLVRSILNLIPKQVPVETDEGTKTQTIFVKRWEHYSDDFFCDGREFKVGDALYKRKLTEKDPWKDHYNLAIKRRLEELKGEK